MKKSQFLISNLFNHLPQVSKKMETLQKLEKIKVFLNKPTKESILFMHLKNKQLLIAFNNPIICNEFNKYNTKNLIKNIKEYSDVFSFLPSDLIIKGYVPLSKLKVEKNQPIPIQVFQEKSQGTFINHCTQRDLKQKFEDLRKIILEIQC